MRPAPNEIGEGGEDGEGGFGRPTHLLYFDFWSKISPKHYLINSLSILSILSKAETN